MIRNKDHRSGHFSNNHAHMRNEWGEMVPDYENMTSRQLRRAFPGDPEAIAVLRLREAERPSRSNLFATGGLLNRELFDAFAQSEPGMLFSDRLVRPQGEAIMGMDPASTPDRTGFITFEGGQSPTRRVFSPGPNIQQIGRAIRSPISEVRLENIEDDRFSNMRETITQRLAEAFGRDMEQRILGGDRRSAQMNGVTSASQAQAQAMEQLSRAASQSGASVRDFSNAMQQDFGASYGETVQPVAPKSLKPKGTDLEITKKRRATNLDD